MQDTKQVLISIDGDGLVAKTSDVPAGGEYYLIDGAADLVDWSEICDREEAKWEADKLRVQPGPVRHFKLSTEPVSTRFGLSFLAGLLAVLYVVHHFAAWIDGVTR